MILKWDGLIEMDLRENPWTCECENQWLIDELMPAYLKINETMAKEMTYVETQRPMQTTNAVWLNICVNHTRLTVIAQSNGVISKHGRAIVRPL